MSENTPLKDLAQTITIPADLVKAAGEPPAQELGQGLADIMYLIFSPFKKWRATAEVNIEKYKTEIVKELDKIEPEKRTEPKLSIAGPALEASKYYIEENELRSMFAKLIAASANLDYNDSALPSFVEIIKQLSALDAKNLKELKEIIKSGRPLVAGKLRLVDSETQSGHTLFENYIPLADFRGENCDNYAVSIANLIRLGLISINHNYSLVNKEFHTDLLNLDFYKDAESELEAYKRNGDSYYLNKNLKLLNATWDFTDFGYHFIKCCLD